MKLNIKNNLKQLKKIVDAMLVRTTQKHIFFIY